MFFFNILHVSLKKHDIGIGIINIHYNIESVMFATETATETDTETDVITPHQISSLSSLFTCEKKKIKGKLRTAVKDL